MLKGRGDPGQFETKVTFAEQDGKTTVTMRALFVSDAERDRDPSGRSTPSNAGGRPGIGWRRISPASEPGMGSAGVFPMVDHIPR